MDFPRAFVDYRALAVAIEAADRILVGVAVGPVNLYGVRGGALRGDRREPLRQPGLFRVPPSFVLHPARSQPQEPRRLIIRFHLRTHLLHELMLRNLDAERLALLRVPHARVTAGPNEPGRTGGHGI